MPTALITGASRGLGLALARALADNGWRLVLDASGAADLQAAAHGLADPAEVVALPGDVTDPEHAPRSSRPRGAGSTWSSTTPARSARARDRRWRATRSTHSRRSTRSTCSP